MKTFRTSNDTSAWQAERAALLHRACKSVQARINRGQKISKAIRCVAKRLKLRQFRSDPKRRLALTEKTLRRHFKTWQRGGEVPAAFKLNYHSRRPSVPATLLVRFAEFCACQKLASLKSAWNKFCQRGGSFGRGRHAGKPLKVSYGQLRYNFPAADFYLLQGELKAIQALQTKLAQLRLEIVADIRRRLPDRPPRRRVKRETDFQI